MDAHCQLESVDCATVSNRAREESQLQEVDRCRTVCARDISTSAHTIQSFIEYDTAE